MRLTERRRKQRSSTLESGSGATSAGSGRAVRRQLELPLAPALWLVRHREGGLPIIGVGGWRWHEASGGPFWGDGGDAARETFRDEAEDARQARRREALGADSDTGTTLYSGAVVDT